MAATGEGDAPFFVEALFPFTGTDASSLSFQRGDVIHVLNRLPSGWWDGVLDDDRGWFPSNYVRIISEVEAEEIYSTRELEQQQQQDLRNQHEHQRQMAHAQTRAHEQPQQQRQQVHQNVGQYSQHSQNQLWDERSRPTGEYWEPEVTENGQIYYVNSLTGQRSREIPMEEDGEPHNQREFTQPHGNNSHISTSQHATNGVPIGYGRERSGTTTSQASSSRIDPISATVQRMGSDIGSYPSNATGSNAQAFAPLHRSETPEPWQRRLTPDGQAYYYVNPTTDETRWTRPEPTHGYADPLLHGGAPEQYGFIPPATTSFPQRNQSTNYHGRERTNSEASYSGRERDPRRTSVYSDTSEVSPLGPDPHHQLHHAKKDIRPWPTPGAQGTDAGAGKQGDETNPLQIAITLQGEMAPPALPPLTVYSERACEAIGAVVQAYGDPLSLANGTRSNAQRDGDGASEGPEGVDHQPQGEADERTSLDAQSIQAMTDRVALVVIAVRNLLYVSGTLTGSLPNLGGSLSNPHGINPHGTGLNGVGAGLNEDVDWVRQEIKPFQRKVTATLSKLVLSARAVNSNPDWPRLAAGGSPSAAASRVENDASELERAVTTFVYQISKSAASSRAKRLYGALMPGEGSAGIGPGLIGAGIGGGWKGAGFVPVRDGMLHNGPEIRLGREVVSELASLEQLTGERINTLRVSVESYKVAAPAALVQGRNYDPRAADVVILNGRLTVAAISDFLMHAEEVHIATGVDVMGTADDDDVYLASVKRARELIRMFETAKQALYDDGSVLLMASQAMHVSSLGTASSVTKASGPADVLLQTAIPALQANLGCIMEALELLLDVAREQDEVQAQRMPQIGAGGVPPATDYPHDREYYRGVLRRQTEFMNPGLYEPMDPYEPADNDEINFYEALGPGYQRPVGNLPYGLKDPENRHSEVPSETTTLKPEPAPPTEPKAGEDPGEQSDDSQKKPKRKDMTKILGETPPAWYLQLDYTGPTHIVINPDGSVKAATLPALIERLTVHTSLDARLTNTFMMTFKSFATIDQVFDMLVERYNIQPPEGLSQSEIEDWAKQKKTPIKLRVINTMRKLIDVLEKEDLRILDRVKAFASDIVTAEPERDGVAKTLLGIVQRVEKNGIESKRTMHTTTSDFPPPSILPRKINKLKLLDIDPLELARQLTILESELFFKIKQSECIARAKDSTPAGPDNIKNVITLANQMAHWVADAVLSKEDPRRRAAVIKHFINVAERCRNLSNYSSMAALLAGLNCPPIRRLKRTWEQVNVRVTSVLDDLEATLDTAHNFQGYKAIISRRQPPCVPFLGVYLTVLTFIQDGARDTLSEGGLINFQKRQKTADVIQEITKFQMLPYNLTKLATIRQFIDESLAALPEDPDFWQLSLDREPREREDEKMARLLQESGFL